MRRGGARRSGCRSLNLCGSLGDDELIEPGDVPSHAVGGVLHDALGVGIEFSGGLSLGEPLNELGSASLQESEPCCRGQVPGERPSKAEAALVIRGGRRVEQALERGSPLVGELVDLLRSSTPGSDEALGPLGGTLTAERSGGRQCGSGLFGIDHGDISRSLKAREGGVERSKRDVRDEPQLGSQSPTDLVAVKGPVAEQSENRKI